MEPIVSVENVSKQFRIPHEKRDTLKENVLNFFHKMEYEEYQALNDINFHLSPGEFFGVVGRNGSGKSTLLKLIAGIYQPSSGTIKANGSMAPFLELGVGFQPELTARENIHMNATLLGLDRKAIERKFDQIIAFAEIENFVDLKLKNFSSGMRSRLAFAIAKEADADLYLVDEVLAVGDEQFQKKCLDVFRQWKSQGKSLLFVSHNPGLVTELCERAVLLEKGRQIAIGPADKVMDKYHQLINIGENSNQENNFLESPITITDVIFTDESGKSRRNFKTGETIVARVSFDAKEKVLNPVFGLAIHRSDGVHVSGPNTKTSSFTINEVKGKGTVECVFHNNSLLGGTYQLSASIFDYPCVYPYDYKERKFMFTIEKNRDNQYGLVEVPVSWRISI
ncbi:ABC transporter ATP-binding protein [Candidatus Peregrinibacteria bacterium]|nr:ABC transporter ATP-binding protein [Candidatus Peregrinibacteria bacterium]